jgi:hypothetical protein
MMLSLVAGKVTSCKLFAHSFPWEKNKEALEQSLSLDCGHDG